MQNLTDELKRRRASLENDTSCGSSESTTTEENIDHFHHAVIGDRRLTINQTKNAIPTCAGEIENILCNELE